MLTGGAARRSAAAAAVCVSAALAAGQEPGSTRDVFPSGVEQVTVDVVVVDRDGSPVRGLVAADFTVLEDGARQEITSFEAIDTGALPAPSPAAGDAATVPAARAEAAEAPGTPARVFVIVFDDLHLDAADVSRARAAIEGFLDRGVAAGDLLTLVVPGRGSLWHARVPEGVGALRRLLPQLTARARTSEKALEWMTDDEAVRIRDGDPLVFRRVVRRWVASATDVLSFRDPATVEQRVLDSARYISFDVERRTRQTLEVLSRALDALVGVRGRKSVVLVSAGIVRDTFLPGFRAVVSASARANAAVHFVDARGLAALGPDQTAEAAAPTDVQDVGLALAALDAGTEGAEAIAADTGGLSIRKRNDLAAGLSAIARESSSYYLVGYPSPAGGRPDRFRRIEVRVAREGVRVRSRRGYYPAAADEAVGARASARALERAVDSPLDATGIPLRAAVSVLGERPGDKVGVLVTAEVDVRAVALREEGASSVGTVDLVVAVLAGENGALHRSDDPVPLRLGADERERLARTWLPLTREAALAPGAYQARVVVRDAASGRVGSLVLDFVVPGPAGLRISRPVLGDRLRRGAAGSPEPVVRRTFAASGTLHVQFEVCGAKKGAPVKAGFAVVRGDGTMIAASPATPISAARDGTLSRSFGIPLDGVPAGRYELVVVAEDEATGDRAETREAFVVADGEGP
jgi:VWFA-related protein